MKLFLSTLCALSFIFMSVQAQEKSNIKYGKVSVEDLQKKIYSIDSNANAIVLAEIGSTEIVGNSKNSFSLEFKHFKRVHILNKAAYDEANVEIPLFTNGEAEEELVNLKAVTYNLENGKVVETKLEKSAIFKEKKTKNWIYKKFAFPNIKEGCIIEYEYKVSSDFLFNLQPWEFQSEYPRLWSEYNLSLPEFLGYVFLSQGYQSYFIKDQKQRNEEYRVSENRTAGATEQYEPLKSNVTDYRWVMKNVPALKEESYTSTIENHTAKIEFQLSDIRFPLTPRVIMGSWPKLTEDLLKEESFGLLINRDNGWLSDIIKPLVNGAANDLEKAKLIYAYVRDNYKCTDHSELEMSQTLRNIVKSKNGTVSEINLLLTAMLKYADIKADPVILSTRSHGYTFSMYPLLKKFNYVVCQLNIGDKVYYLDATHPRLGFGRLDAECYNGHARVVNEAATPIEFNTDSLLERKMTSVFIANDDKGNMIGSMQQTPGYYESYRLRNKIKEKGKEQFIKDLGKDYGMEVEIKDPHIDSLEKLEENLGIKYDFVLKPEKTDIIYLNPMLGEGHKENPFKSAQRLYPVEMPFTMDEIYLFSMQVPDGYVVDELPKQVVVKYNEQGDGQFEYRITESGNTISMRSRITLKRSYFTPDEYETLREFFNLIVKKHSEQIVFKKKK
jgi:hypothetical protein